MSALSDEDPLKEYEKLDKADKLYLYGKYARAIPIYVDLLKKTKNEVIKVRIYSKLGKAYYFLKDFQKSEYYLTKVLQSKVTFKELTKGARFFLSGIYERKRKYEDAINVLIPLGEKRDYYSFLAARKINRIISEHPEKNLNKNYNLIDFYITQRKYQNALEIIELFLREKKTAELLYLKGKLLFIKGKYKEALSLFNEILEKGDENYKNKALYYKATILSYMNKVDEALNIYQSLPLSPTIMLKIAYIYGKKGDKERKLEIYKKFLKKFPLSYQVTYIAFNLAQYYENKQKLDEAIYYYDILINKYPKSRLVDDALYRELVIYKKLNEKDKINKLKKLLIEKYPTSIYAYHVNNYKLTLTKRFSLSLENLFEYGQDKEEILNTTLLLFKKKMYEDAYYEAKRLYDKGERSLVLLYLLSISSEKIGRYYDSMRFREAIYYYLKEREGGVSVDLVKFVYPKFYKTIVKTEAKKYHLDPLLIYSIIREESRFGKNVLSPSYAIGLMQIIPSTGEWIAKKLGVKEFDEIMLFNPVINIEFGVWYVNYLNKLFSRNVDAVLASYNGGPGNGKKWFKETEGKDRIEVIENNIGYSESKEYVKKCLSSYYTYKNLELYTEKNNP